MKLFLAFDWSAAGDRIALLNLTGKQKEHSDRAAASSERFASSRAGRRESPSRRDAGKGGRPVNAQTRFGQRAAGRGHEPPRTAETRVGHASDSSRRGPRSAKIVRPAAGESRRTGSQQKVGSPLCRGRRGTVDGSMVAQEVERHMAQRRNKARPSRPPLSTNTPDPPDACIRLRVADFVVRSRVLERERAREPLRRHRHARLLAGRPRNTPVVRLNLTGFFPLSLKRMPR